MASNMIDANVKLTSGRTVCFPVTCGETINELCAKVAGEEKVPADVVTLKFDGKVLKRCKRMSDLGVRPETVLKVKVMAKQTLQMNLKTLPGDEVISVKIHNTSPLTDIKKKFLAVRPDLENHPLTFKLGDMVLNWNNYAYEECLVDGDNMTVNIGAHPHLANQEPEEEMQEEERQEVLNSFVAGMTSERLVDIVFSFDTTGSMNALLATVRERLRVSVRRLISDIPNIRIGIMAHGDYCDQHRYVLKKQDLTPNRNELVDFVNSTPGSGGEGDFACYEYVLKHANQLSWREEAAKALVIIGDVVPHETTYTNLHISWRDELQSLCDKGVKVYGVQARDHRPANSFYGFMSRKSGGAHIKFQHFPLITDMFLAVCYRESGDDQLQAYCDEVRNEGRMTEEMMDVMKQLEKKPEDEEEEEEEKEEEKKKEEAEGADPPPQAQRRQRQEEEYVPAAWWDEQQNFRTEPAYIYTEENDVWARNNQRGSDPYESSPSHVTSHISSNRLKSKKFKGKKGCSVM